MNDSEQRFDFLFKIVLIGDSNVGKTNLLSRLIKNEALSESKPTIGVEFGTKTFKFDDSVVKAQIWDTAGQERYHAITAAYYRGSNGAVIVYDMTQKNSLENACAVWLANLRNSTDSGIPIMLLGNKNDLAKHRTVSQDEGRSTAMREGLGFFETSAVSGENVAEAFETFVRQIYEREKKKQATTTKAKVRREDMVGKELKMKKKKSTGYGCC